MSESRKIIRLKRYEIYLKDAPALATTTTKNHSEKKKAKKPKRSPPNVAPTAQERDRAGCDLYQPRKQNNPIKGRKKPKISHQIACLHFAS